jgi:hypothetical protein
MRFVTLAQLAEWTADGDFVAVGFPYESSRASGAGDPSLHELGQAIDLFILSTRVLSARYGEPDFPSAERPSPAGIVDDAVAAVVWDYDYYRLVLSLDSSDDPGPRKYRVCYRTMG